MQRTELENERLLEPSGSLEAETSSPHLADGATVPREVPWTAGVTQQDALRPGDRSPVIYQGEDKAAYHEASLFGFFPLAPQFGLAFCQASKPASQPVSGHALYLSFLVILAMCDAVS